MAQHPQILFGDVTCSAIVSGIRFLDADGNERTSMQKLVQGRIREFKEAGQTLLEVTFLDPTFAGGLVDKIRHLSPANLAGRRPVSAGSAGTKC